jgi:hypothetical protein
VSSHQLFSLGEVFITPGALEALERAGQMPNEVLDRHHCGDWGELDERDRRENAVSLEHGFRLLSAYRTANDVRL